MEELHTGPVKHRKPRCAWDTDLQIGMPNLCYYGNHVQKVLLWICSNYVLDSFNLLSWTIYWWYCFSCSAFFQPGNPIYSAKFVRIKMSHPNPSLNAPANEKYVWTYISLEFPMAQVCKFFFSNSPCLSSLPECYLFHRILYLIWNTLYIVKLSF